MFGQNSTWGQNNQQQQQNTQQQGGGLFGGGGGFGQQQQPQQQQNTGFGQSTGGFGQPAQQNTGGLFGGASTSTNTGFGFGANTNTTQNNAFGGGARPGFGASGSTFGQPTSTGGGLFGASNTSTNTFGAQNTGNSLFGKPATTTSTFGGGQTSGLFGAKPAGSSPFGAQAGNNPNQVYQYTPGPFPPPPQTGTAAPQYQDTWQGEPGTGKDVPAHLFHVITAMEPYKGASFEELRAMDYQQGRKDAGASAAAGTNAFGATTGGFGQPAASTSTFGQPAATSTFGAAKPGGLFGGGTTGTTGFGQTSTGFGSGSTTTFGGNQQQQQTSPFGATSNTTGGLFGQTQQQPATGGGLFGSTNTTFGQNNQQQQAGSTFGGFGASKPFGSTPATTGFGQPAAGTSTFGQPAQNSGTTGFGGFGQTQQQPQQQQTGGLFGGGFGQTNTQPASGGLFGQTNQQQQQPATGGLFGNTAAKPGGLFGSTTTNNAAAPTSTFSFGQNNTQQPAAGGSSLFGNTSTQPSTGLFGQTNQQQQPAQTGGLFGNNSTAGGGLFGAKPATTAPGTGLFGSQPAQQPAQTGGLFGNTAAQPSTSLFGGGNNTFGQQNQQNNAAKPAGTGMFGGSLFGNTSQQPAQQASTGGLFGGTLGQSQPASGGLFGSTTQQPNQPALGGSLFGSTLGQSTAAQPQQPTLTASLDQNPYGNNALFAYNGQKLDYGLSTKKPALPPLTSSSFNLTPRKSTNKLRGFASPLAESLSISRSQSPGLSSPRRAYGSPAGADRYKGLTDAALTPNAFVPRPSVKKLTITPKNASLFSSEDHLEAVLGKSALRSTPSRNGTADAPKSPAPPVPPPSTSPTAPKSSLPANGNAPNSTPLRKPPPADKPAPPKKGDYWCRPKLDRLKQLSPKELSSVENFSAGRTGFGEVSFQTPVDLTGLDLDTFLGEALVFSDMELAVYPEDYPNKAPQGKGLNVPAQITLENCFPKDKATKQPITDTSDPRHVKFLKRVKSVPDTDFVGYTNDGQWTFKVQHFSKYGLRDSDDESDPGAPATDVAKAKAREAYSKDMVPSDEEQGDEYDDDDEESEEDMLPTKSMYDIPEEHDSGVEDESGADESMGEESTASSSSASDDIAEDTSPRRTWDPAAPLTSRLGEAGMRNVREMQAGFYGDAPRKRKAPGDGGQVAAAMERAKRIQPLAGAGFESAEGGNGAADRAISGASFGDKSGPSRKLTPRKYAKVPLADSFVHQHEGIRADAGLALGRSFRCSWGPNGQLVHFGKICSPSTAFTSAPQATVYIQQVDLLSEPFASENQRANRLLTLHLRRTRVEVDEEDIPCASIDDTIHFADFAKLFEGADRGHEASIFRLGQALFDEIDLRLPDGAPSEIAERLMDVRRKLALSKWLEDTVSPYVDHDLVKTDSRPSQIFALLTGNQLNRAVNSALEGSDMRLATLLSQIGGPANFRSQVQKQLDEWKKYKASAQISPEYRRLYALFAGITDLLPGDTSRGVDHAPDVKISEGLDWKRAFGLRLWYGNPFEDTIADVLASYTDGLSSKTPPALPLPPYLEIQGSKNGWKTPTRPTDILYNLLRLYADGGVSLDQTLHARDISPSPTDYRIMWHLYMLLHRVLRVRDFDDRDVETLYSATADAVTVSYATQLEEAGEWRWAAFVLLHLETPSGRKAAIKALLHRHPDPSEADIAHLTGVLHIPRIWLYEARADLLASQGNVYAEYHALLQAHLWNRAHRVLIRTLAPEAVLRGDLALVRKLCAELDGKPSGWESGGKLFLDYANVLDTSSQLRSVFDRATEAGTGMRDLAKTVPRLLQLLPALFPSQTDLQQVATLSDMLSALQKLAAGLHNAGLIARPPISSALVDVDRLHLLQNAAFDGFTKALNAVSSSA